MSASEFAVETARVQHPAWIEDLLHLLLQSWRQHWLLNTVAVAARLRYALP
jgi:hypothetical protein